jgi:hypothetical protein
MLVQYNGNPVVRKLVLELADGLLAHRKRDENGRYSTHSDIHFRSDRDEDAAPSRALPLIWAAWRWTGNPKYLDPFRDEGLRMLESINNDALDWLDLRKEWGPRMGAARPGGGRGAAMRHFAWQLSGDKKILESLYADQIEAAALREFINTEGSLWIDRVNVPDAELQRARLGGVALVRNAYYPGHAVSWRFPAPASDSSVAVLVPQATPQSLKIVAYNLEQAPVRATMTGWEIDPGKWEVVQGVDTNGGDSPDGKTTTRTVTFERTRDLEFTLPPRTATVLNLRLVSPGKPYWERPDLGIGTEDVRVAGNVVTVKVHSLGAVGAPAASLSLIDAHGKRLATAAVPAMKAPTDLQPKAVEVRLTAPAGAWSAGARVVIDPDGRIEEITRMNNSVGFR